MDVLDNNKKKYPFWKTLLIIGGVCIATQILLSIGVFAFNLLLKNKLGITASQKDILEYLSLIITPASFFVAWFIVKNQNLVKFNFNFSLKKIDFRLIILSYILIYCFSIVSEPLVALMPKELYKILQDYIAGGIVAIIGAVIIAPIFEELLFRGIIQKMAIYRFGAVAGIIFGGVLFGIIHMIPQQIIHASFVGIILGYAYYKTGNIWTPIIIHFINNGLIAFLMYCTDIDIEAETKTMINNNVIYCILYVVCFVVVAFGTIKVIKDIKKIEQQKNNIESVDVQ